MAGNDDFQWQLTTLLGGGEGKKTQSFSSPLNSSSFDAYIVDFCIERIEKNHDALSFLWTGSRDSMKYSLEFSEHRGPSLAFHWTIPVWLTYLTKQHVLTAHQIRHL